MEPEFLHIVGIREEAHVKHQVGIRRDPILETETHDCDEHAAASIRFAVEIFQLMAQFFCQKSAGVDDLVRLFF